MNTGIIADVALRRQRCNYERSIEDINYQPEERDRLHELTTKTMYGGIIA